MARPRIGRQPGERGSGVTAGGYGSRFGRALTSTHVRAGRGQRDPLRCAVSPGLRRHHSAPKSASADISALIIVCSRLRIKSGLASARASPSEASRADNAGCCHRDDSARGRCGRFIRRITRRPPRCPRPTRGGTLRPRYTTMRDSTEAALHPAQGTAADGCNTRLLTEARRVADCSV